MSDGRRRIDFRVRVNSLPLGGKLGGCAATLYRSGMTSFGWRAIEGRRRACRGHALVTAENMLDAEDMWTGAQGSRYNARPPPSNSTAIKKHTYWKVSK